MYVLFGLCPALSFKIPHHMADVNTTANKFNAVIHHFVKNVLPLRADYSYAGQIDQQLASLERIARVFPGSVEFRGPGFNNPARENELSLNSAIDRCDFQHYVSAAAMRKNCNASAKDAKTTSH